MTVWGYEGKRVALVGCFSGMGEATARELVRLGAEVHGFDIRPSPAPLASFATVDMGDPASIDGAVDGFDGEIDALFNSAGLPQTFPAVDVMKSTSSACATGRTGGCRASGPAAPSARSPRPPASVTCSASRR